MIRYLELDNGSELHKRPRSRKGQLRSQQPWLVQATLEIRAVHQMIPPLGAQTCKRELLGPFYEALTLACAQV